MSNIDKFKHQLSEGKDPLDSAKAHLKNSQIIAKNFEKVAGDLDMKMQQLAREIEDLSSQWRQSDPKRKDDMTFQKIADELDDVDSSMSELRDTSYRVLQQLKKAKIK